MSGDGAAPGSCAVRSTPSTGGLRLLLVASGLAVVWLVVLPWVAGRPVVARHLRAMEEGEVNAAAMVYTDLERLPLRPEWVERHLVLWP